MSDHCLTCDERRDCDAHQEGRDIVECDLLPPTACAIGRSGVCDNATHAGCQDCFDDGGVEDLTEADIQADCPLFQTPRCDQHCTSCNIAWD